MKESLALDLYKVFRSELYESYRLHKETLQNYLAFSTTILAATIAGMLKIVEMNGVGWIGWTLLFGPALNVFICNLAMKMCDRFYLGAAERMAIIMKLEEKLGIREVENTEASEEGNIAFPFPKDKYFLPKRWIKSKGDSSEQFIRSQKNAGVNRLAKRTFYSMIVVNILLSVGIMVRLSQF